MARGMVYYRCPQEGRQIQYKKGKSTMRIKLKDTLVTYRYIKDTDGVPTIKTGSFTTDKQRYTTKQARQYHKTVMGIPNAEILTIDQVPVVYDVPRDIIVKYRVKTEENKEA